VTAIDRAKRIRIEHAEGAGAWTTPASWHNRWSVGWPVTGRADTPFGDSTGRRASRNLGKAPTGRSAAAAPDRYRRTWIHMLLPPTVGAVPADPPPTTTGRR